MAIFFQVRVWAKAAIAAAAVRSGFVGKVDAIVAAMRFFYLAMHEMASWGLSLFMRDAYNLVRLGMNVLSDSTYLTQGTLYPFI